MNHCQIFLIIMAYIVGSELNIFDVIWTMHIFSIKSTNLHKCIKIINGVFPFPSIIWYIINLCYKFTILLELKDLRYSGCSQCCWYCWDNKLYNLKSLLFMNIVLFITPWTLVMSYGDMHWSILVQIMTCWLTAVSHYRLKPMLTLLAPIDI